MRSGGPPATISPEDLQSLMIRPTPLAFDVPGKVTFSSTIMAFIDYFFSGSKYIRVSRNDTGPGSVDAGYPQPITNWEWPGGFGADGIEAALYSGSKCYFFKGAEYVRVTLNGTANAGQQGFTAPHPISEWG
jgi:Hemopexin